VKKSVFFRLDASPEIGLGHLRRCLVLARECGRLGSTPHFLIRSCSLDPERLDIPEGGIVSAIPWDAEPADDAALIVRYCADAGVDAGVLDHYRFADGYQKILRDGGLRWMQFGNLMHCHALEGDLVHDASPGAKPSDYAARAVNPRTRFLAGPSYALVGEPFRAARGDHSRGSQDEVRRVLLTFGGGDDHGATLASLDWLEAAGYRGEAVILTTRMNPSLPAIRARSAASTSVSLRVDDWNPAPQMAACQLAISAGGTSLHELACLGVPALIACIAENQVAPARAWHRAGLGVLLGNIADIPSGAAAGTIGTLLNDHKIRREMSERCMACQDGGGASRTAAELLN